jgi:ABC-2 type transport system permease protein
MTFVELLAWSVWELLRPRKLLTMAIVGGAGPAFAVLLRLVVPERDYSGDIAYSIVVPFAVYGFTLILLSIVFASGIVSAEMTGRTIPYLLTRPIPRWKILLAKWFAASLMVAFSTCVSCIVAAVITHGPGDVANSNLLRDLRTIPVGALSYCSLFTFLSVVSTKPWLFAISFGFLWESWVPLLPGDFQKLSIMTQLRALSPQPNSTMTHGIEDFLRMLNPESISIATAWNILLVVNIVSLALACAIFSSAEFVPKEEAA